MWYHKILNHIGLKKKRFKPHRVKKKDFKPQVPKKCITLYIIKYVGNPFGQKYLKMIKKKKRKKKKERKEIKHVPCTYGPPN
jgi:hypothetical protein